MADYVDGVKIAELPEAGSVSDGNLFVTEDSDATKQVTADKLKTYTNAELLQEVESLTKEVSELKDSLTELESGKTTANDLTLSSGTDIVDWLAENWALLPSGLSTSHIAISSGARCGMIIDKYDFGNGYGAAIIFGYSGVGSPPYFLRMNNGTITSYEFSCTQNS